MTPDETGQDRGRQSLTRRAVLSIGAGATAAGLGIGGFAGTAAAWERLAVDFRSESQVWLIVGDDLHYDPPVVAHVVVDTGHEVECRLVEFTAENATTVPDEYGDTPVVKHDASGETVLGVVPYNRHDPGDGRFSRPRCVMPNDHLEDSERVASACREADCVQAAVTDQWGGHLKECWFDPLDDVVEGSDVREIDSCTEITEPGEYELVSDLHPEDSATCLEIRAENVTIDGDGHAIDGSAVPDDAESTGILIDAVSDFSMPDERAGVRIHDVHVREWDRGVSATEDDLVRITDSVVRDNVRGVDLGTGLNDVRIELDGVTLESNEREAVRSLGFNAITATASTIRNNGTGVRTGDTDVELTSSTVRNNDDVGVFVSDARATLTETTVAGNGGNGIEHRFTPLTVESVTVRDNDGHELGVPAPTEPEGAPAVDLHATDFVVGESTTIAASDAALGALDAIPVADLPDVPDDARAVGEGLDVIGMSSIPMDVTFDVSGTDDSVELWRHDGSEWTVVDDATVRDGSIEAAIDGNGIYAPVAGDDS